ncbi:VCBS repeat-containing protein [Snuella sedimenti]|uniref:VCBS repeat-containing protein n=1 Tax=Snuella sedimenti TaxID=2798802 RepID=A0A8J7II78_9FLAO|nr:VCBS repeat-containing protein [Snuella sedimenti]MBJ6368791.1 VCBS repeat-containing protein [Snuella sedimenti]
MKKSIVYLSALYGIIATLMLPVIGYSQQSKQFTLLKPSQSGVYFNNTVKDTRESNVLIYSNYYGGAGVGIADFNNDGLQDLFFAGNQVGDRLYLNKGNMQFKDLTIEAGIQDNGGWSSGVVIGDVNNDGWQDIYVTRELYDNSPELRKNKLYINTSKDAPVGTISFKESAESYKLANDERTRHATFLDYNKDGLLDIFLLNQPPNPGNYSEMYYVDRQQEKFAPRLYENNGNNTFTDVTKKAGLLKTGNANSVALFDANNDGWQDIYLANDYASPDAFYLNNGNGTFTNIADEALRHISYFSMGVDAADINNDGKLDLMVLDMVAEDNYRLKSNMSGMNPNAFWKIVQNGGHYQYMFNTLQLNHGIYDGIPQFGDIAQMAGVPSTDWSWSNVIADFDNDGLKDIYVTNGLMRDIRNTDSDKKVGKYITKVADNFVKNNPNGGTVSIWDILDVEKALSLIPSVKLANYAYKNVDGLTFSKVSDEWGLDEKTFSAGCAYGDLDNDGDLDLVINNVNDVASIYRNNSDQKSNYNYLRVKLTNKKTNKTLQGARVEVVQDKQHQMYEFTSVRGMYSSSEQVAHFGFSKNSKIDSVIVTWPDQEKSITTSVALNQLLTIDYNISKRVNPEHKTNPITVFTEIENFKHRHVENNFDDFEKQVLLPHKQSQFGPALTSGDVNGDGLEDIFIGAALGRPATLYLQKKNGKFTIKPNKEFLEDAKFEDIDALFFDVENDGDLDLYVVSGGNNWKTNSENYQDRLYLNDSKGNFTKSKKTLPKLTESGACVRAFDYDDDGYLDLFVGGRHSPWDYPSPVTSRILKNDNGKFSDVTKSIANDLINIGMVTDAIWLDYNEDGLTDLVLTGEWMPITFIKNMGGKFQKDTANNGLLNSNGWWYSIAAADMDNDGDIDLVAGNLGLNYKYKASEREPFEVFYDDFDSNGQKDIVLSYYNFGEQFPLRGRSCSSQQIPKIAEEIKTYDLFASLNLTEVYGETNLASALHYKAKTFANTYIENNGNGKFKAIPLPYEAQISNGNDILLDDFDNDGHNDILMVGNLYPVEIETTRNDAGIGMFLKGNGSGAFLPQPMEKSGVFLPQDVKKLIAVKLNNESVIITASNNGFTKCFKINNTAK